MKLFFIYIGGKHEKSLIELHDIRLIAAENIEETYPLLKSTWWGTPESLHLDCWGILNHVDGYDLSLEKHPQHSNLETTNKLYFINLGGYDPKQFTELHQNVFVIAQNEKEAKLKALQKMPACESPHRDYLFEAENVLNCQTLLDNTSAPHLEKFYLHLIPNPTSNSFEFTCQYVPIGKIAE